VPSGPSSNADPPPSLPFNVPAMNAAMPQLEATEGPAIQMPHTAPPANKKGNEDPPPSLPVALATWSN
jgi:hypothetical protein